MDAIECKASQGDIALLAGWQGDAVDFVEECYQLGLLAGMQPDNPLYGRGAEGN